MSDEERPEREIEALRWAIWNAEDKAIDADSAGISHLVGVHRRRSAILADLLDRMEDLCDCGHRKNIHGYYGCISSCDCRIDWMGDLPGTPRILADPAPEEPEPSTEPEGEELARRLAEQIVQSIADSPPSDTSIIGQELLKGSEAETCYVLPGEELEQAIYGGIADAFFDGVLRTPEPAGEGGHTSVKYCPECGSCDVPECCAFGCRWCRPDSTKGVVIEDRRIEACLGAIAVVLDRLPNAKSDPDLRDGVRGLEWLAGRLQARRSPESEEE